MISDQTLVELFLEQCANRSTYEAGRDADVDAATVQRFRNGTWTRLWAGTRRKLLRFLQARGVVTPEGEIAADYQDIAPIHQLTPAQELLLAARLLTDSVSMAALGGRLTFRDIANWLKAHAEARNLDPEGEAEVAEYVAVLLRLHARGAQGHDDSTPVHEGKSATARP